MATLDPNFTLELTTIKLVAGAAIDYSSMPLNPALPDASQLQVRWNVTTVYQGNSQSSGGTPVTVSTLSQTLQDEIQTLLITMYTVDAGAKTVTINAASTIEDQITFGNYYFPSAFNVGSSQPIVIRRDTNVTNANVVFSPGSRLTSELLNTSDAQMLNAIQEIVAFGDGNSSGGSEGTIDLGTYSIFDLGDVSPASGTGLLSYDTGTGLVTTGGAGSLVPAGGPEGREYLRKAGSGDGDVEWYDLTLDINAINTDIASNALNITTLQDKTQHQTADAASTVFTSSTDQVITFRRPLDPEPAPQGYSYWPRVLIKTGWNPGTDSGYPENGEPPSSGQGTNFYISGATQDFTPNTGYNNLWYNSSGCSDNRIWRGNFRPLNYHILRDNRDGTSDTLNASYNYTMLSSPGDQHDSVLGVTYGGATTVRLTKDGDFTIVGDLAAQNFDETSDATLKTYDVSENPDESTELVIAKVQAMVAAGEANAATASNLKFGAFSFNRDTTAQLTSHFYYGPTTQLLTAHGLGLMKGRAVNVPAVPAEPDTTNPDGSIVPGTPEVPALPATETASVTSLSGLAIKCSAQLKDGQDLLSTAVTAIDDYLTDELLPWLVTLEGRVTALEGGPSPQPGPPTISPPIVVPPVASV